MNWVSCAESFATFIQRHILCTPKPYWARAQFVVENDEILTIAWLSKSQRIVCFTASKSIAYVSSVRRGKTKKEETNQTRILCNQFALCIHLMIWRAVWWSILHKTLIASFVSVCHQMIRHAQQATDCDLTDRDQRIRLCINQTKPLFVVKLCILHTRAHTLTDFDVVRGQLCERNEKKKRNSIQSIIPSSIAHRRKDTQIESIGFTLHTKRWPQKLFISIKRKLQMLTKTSV